MCLGSSNWLTNPKHRWFRNRAATASQRSPQLLSIRSATAALTLLISSASLCFAGGSDLRVCADPDNLPYSNSRQQGFENKLAELVGRELGRSIQYEWIPQRGRFFQAFQHGLCDVVMGVPSGFQLAQTTQPYYRSSYVFVSRHDKRLGLASFDDPRLKTLRIALPVVAADDGDIPPAQALTHRGIVRNIIWYRMTPGYIEKNRPAGFLDAIQSGAVDVAIAWGPVAGYLAKQTSMLLDVIPVSPQKEGAIPFAFDISMGVRPGDGKLVAELNSLIHRRRKDIHELLQEYGVPMVGSSPARKLATNR